MPPTSEWLLHCRGGFEGTCAAELSERLQLRGFPAVYAKARPRDAWLRLINPMSEQDMGQALDTRAIFARQIVAVWEWLEDLPENDRVSPIIDAIPSGVAFGGLQLASADSNEGKALGRLLKPLSHALRQGLKRAGVRLDAENGPCLQIFFPDGRRAAVAYHLDATQPAGGIQRLRMPSQAPSRSTLKLDEAFKSLLIQEERERWLGPGGTAVDLGAAPGGWSWQMVRRHIHVTAVDNGPMDPLLLDSGLLSHVRADGFTWRPPRPVDWLLCDIVDKPARVSHRMGQWLSNGWARHAAFNLKLPMKQAWPTVRDLLSRLEEQLAEARPGLQLRARHLYHDRDEITVIALDAT